MIHICQPEAGRLSSGHLDLEECESLGKIKASRAFMPKVGADLQMCFSPSHGVVGALPRSGVTCSLAACHASVFWYRCVF